MYKNKVIVTKTETDYAKWLKSYNEWTEKFSEFINEGDGEEDSEEEDGEGGCMDEFLDLIFTEIAEESGFLGQAVGFIDDESLEGIRRCFRESPGADEEIGNAGFPQCAGELVLVDVTGSAVLSDILGDQLAVG